MSEIIKLMESENVLVIRKSETEIALIINGVENYLTVDALNELRTVTDHFWSANDLWQWTKQAIAERQQYQQNAKEPVQLTSMRM